MYQPQSSERRLSLIYRDRSPMEKGMGRNESGSKCVFLLRFSQKYLEWIEESWIPSKN